MGNCCLTGPTVLSQAESPNKPTIIEDTDKDIRIVFLGTGDSGKSTFFKQVNYLYQSNDTKNSLGGDSSFTSAIYTNILDTMQALIKSIEDYNEKNPDNQLLFANPTSYECAARLKLVETSSRKSANVYTDQVADDVEELWKEDVMKKVFETRYEYHVFDGAPHFFLKNDLKRFRQPYKPTFEDVLYCRRKTTGVIEAKVNFSDFRLVFIDVGGQRSERKKWVQVFGGLEALIFVISLSEFDQLCYEDDVTPRMIESLDLFEETINTETFCQTPVIVFFNKVDIFEEKLKTKSIKTVFPEYEGGGGVEESTEYIKNKFLSRNKHDPGRIYTRCTTATNSDAVKSTIEMVRDTVFEIRKKNANG
ncbi:guanine nucleotide-binding protein G(o) subunit alpha [Acrasis kona]|uniref:Guanine nucleotide-binding protein G(O) subunit alpha n=1 Tax=Acrasis kona TaxID=1008807 RepID=A0AAW2Z1I9_9EUKA